MVQRRKSVKDAERSRLHPDWQKIYQEMETFAEGLAPL